MGTDRTKEFEGPCKCGKGTYVIDRCTPDHSWVTSHSLWYEPQITCAVCNEEYKLEKRGNQFFLVQREDLANLEAKSHEWFTGAEAFMAKPKIRVILKQLSQTLSRHPSVAATHRHLQSLALSDQTVGTFRRHWSGADHWIKTNISPTNFSKVMRALGISDPTIDAELTEIQKKWQESTKPAPAYGAAIHDLT